MGMNASEATADFGRAKELFGAGQYKESMRLLVDLDRQYPNTRNILLAMATCLEKLECPGEAEQICDRLLALGPDPKAAEIKARINAARNAANIGGIYGPIDLDMALRASAPRPPATPAPTDRRRMILIGAVVAVAVLLLAIPLILRGPQRAAPAVAQQAQSIAAGQTLVQQDGPQLTVATAVPLAVAYFLAVLASYVVSILVFYPCLRFTGHLREESLRDNLQDLFITMLFVYLWCLIPLVGWIFGLIHFMRHYELTCLEVLIITFVAGILQTFIMMFFIYPMLFGAGVAIVGATT